MQLCGRWWPVYGATRSLGVARVSLRPLYHSLPAGPRNHCPSPPCPAATLRRLLATAAEWANGIPIRELIRANDTEALQVGGCIDILVWVVV